MSSDRRRLANRRDHVILDFEHDGLAYTAGIGRFPNGGVAEVFLSAGKPGCQAESAARDGAILVSLALQHGATLDEIRHSLTRLRNGNAAGPIGRVLDLLAAEGDR